MEEGNLTNLIVVLSVLFGLFSLFYILPLSLWIMAKISGVRISLLELTFMKMRSVAVVPIVKSMIMAQKAGLSIRKEELEAHSLAGGNVENVVAALIHAKNKELKLSFREACELDLAEKIQTK